MADKGGQNQYIVENWDTDAGLPVNSIQAIAQNDYLWIGTDAGLVRFDGDSLETFTMTNTPILKSDRILALHIDNRNRLWIGTDGGGLYSCHGEEWKEYSLTNNHIKTITSDWNGNVWVGTGYGLCKLKNGSVERFTIDDGIAGNIITALEFDNWGNLWIASLQRGVTKYFDGNFVIYDGDDGLDNLLIKSLFCDKLGNLHVGTVNGIYQLNSNEAIFKKLPQTDYIPASSFLEKNNTIWLGTINDGIKILKQNRIINTDILSGRHIHCLLKNRDGNFWIGTESAGLFRISWKGEPNAILKQEIVSSRRRQISTAVLLAGTGFILVLLMAMLLIKFKPGKSKAVKQSESSNKPADPDIIEKLEKIICHDKIYLDPDLTLKKLAQKVQTHNNYLSRLINEQYDKNYNDFINYYRIEEARRMLSDPKEKKKTVSDIMYRCGFYSKSTFNTAFKKFTGMTPSQYRKKNIADID